MSRTGQQLLGYAGVGAVGTAVHYATLVAGVAGFGVAPVVASSVGALFGALTNYGLNYRFTFRSGRAHTQALPRFAIIAAVGLLVNAGVVDACLRYLGFHYLVAQVVATAAVLLSGFVANRAWTFKDTTDARTST
jgi:putative flippase GtrA